MVQSAKIGIWCYKKKDIGIRDFNPFKNRDEIGRKKCHIGGKISICLATRILS